MNFEDMIDMDMKFYERVSKSPHLSSSYKANIF